MDAKVMKEMLESTGGKTAVYHQDKVPTGANSIQLDFAPQVLLVKTPESSDISVVTNFTSSNFTWDGTNLKWYQYATGQSLTLIVFG